jgi:hypothetical protein
MKGLMKGKTKGVTKGNKELEGFSQAFKCHRHIYITNARKRGLEFSLTADELYKLAKQPCHYCGGAPEKRVFGTMSYTEDLSGWDRIDNNKGYVTGNVVPACKICNRIKWTFSIDDYITHAIRIVQHNRAYSA